MSDRPGIPSPAGLAQYLGPREACLWPPPSSSLLLQASFAILPPNSTFYWGSTLPASSLPWAEGKLATLPTSLAHTGNPRARGLGTERF